jgi:hypothetical protein
MSAGRKIGVTEAADTDIVPGANSATDVSEAMRSHDSRRASRWRALDRE